MEYPKITNEEPQNYITGFYQVGAQQGWQCPICKRVLAPFIPECPCQGMQTITFATSANTINNKTITLNSEVKGEK